MCVCPIECCVFSLSLYCAAPHQTDGIIRKYLLLYYIYIYCSHEQASQTLISRLYNIDRLCRSVQCALYYIIWLLIRRNRTGRLHKYLLSILNTKCNNIYIIERRVRFWCWTVVTIFFLLSYTIVKYIFYYFTLHGSASIVLMGRGEKNDDGWQSFPQMWEDAILHHNQHHFSVRTHHHQPTVNIIKERKRKAKERPPPVQSWVALGYIYIPVHLSFTMTFRSLDLTVLILYIYIYYTIRWILSISYHVWLRNPV